MVKKLGIIVQAHMSSTRLPGKVLKQLLDKSVLGHILTRLKNVRHADCIIVATSNLACDDAIVEECEKYGVLIYRGDDENVLSRFYNAAMHYGLTDIVRVCSDNTLIDWSIIDSQIELYLNGNYDIVTTGLNVPLGLGGEIFSYESLQAAFLNADCAYQYEHVTPYIYEHANQIGKLHLEKGLKEYRFTLDTIEDWLLIKQIYGRLYTGQHTFLLDDVVMFMEKNPHLYEINYNVKQKQVKT